MKISSGQIVILTGASGGLGNYIAQALAQKGTHLMLVAYPGAGLEDLKRSVEKLGVRAVALVADVRDPAQRRDIVDRTIKEFGRVDILINNAGIEFTCPYHELPEQSVLDVLNVNLTAPMILTHMVLPDMLKRKSGFILNISSLAGKCGPAYQEPYAASKAGLINFTTAFRATYKYSGVSASVICPGFVEAGIYARLKDSTGCAAPLLLGTIKPERVVRAVIRAIEKNRPEIIISKWPFRQILAFIAFFPSGGEWLIRATGAHDFFGRIVAAQAKASKKP
jgi:short-subunit dehydrogenase